MTIREGMRIIDEIVYACNRRDVIRKEDREKIRKQTEKLGYEIFEQIVKRMEGKRAQEILNTLKEEGGEYILESGDREVAHHTLPPELTSRIRTLEEEYRATRRK